MNQAELQKKQSAEAAMAYVKDGMIIGLGTGSTAAYFVKALAEAIKDGLSVWGVPTSKATESLAIELGVPLLDVNEAGVIDLTIDGADEIDPDLNLIKGGGAALLREKIIAHNSKQMVVIADESKYVFTLGKFPLPIEVVPFGHMVTKGKIEEIIAKYCDNSETYIRMLANSDTKVITDNGNYLIDCKASAINKPLALLNELNLIPGVVENGLFPIFKGTKRIAILGSEQGPKIIEV